MKISDEDVRFGTVILFFCKVIGSDRAFFFCVRDAEVEN